LHFKIENKSLTHPDTVCDWRTQLDSTTQKFCQPWKKSKLRHQITWTGHKSKEQQRSGRAVGLLVEGEAFVFPHYNHFCNRSRLRMCKLLGLAVTSPLQRVNRKRLTSVDSHVLNIGFGVCEKTKPIQNVFLPLHLLLVTSRPPFWWQWAFSCQGFFQFCKIYMTAIKWVKHDIAGQLKTTELKGNAQIDSGFKRKLN